MKENFKIFFQGFKEFCLSKNLGNFKGLTNREIRTVENQLRIEFPLPLKMYLQYLGEKMVMPNIHLLNATRPSIIKAESIARDKKIRNRIRNFPIVNEWDHTQLDETLNEICFINWVDYNNYFSFIKLDDPISNIYGWDNDCIIYKWENNIIGSLRKELLLGLIRIAKKNDTETQKNDPLTRGLYISQILKDRNSIENVRKYNNKILLAENEKKEIVEIETYIANYISERKNSSI